MDNHESSWSCHDSLVSPAADVTGAAEALAVGDAALPRLNVFVTRALNVAIPGSIYFKGVNYSSSDLTLESRAFSLSSVAPPP